MSISTTRLPDGSRFAVTPNDIVRCWWPHMEAHIDVCYSALLCAGWDRKTFPSLSEFALLDAVEAIEIVFTFTTPQYIRSPVKKRIEILGKFALAWNCFQTAWENPIMITELAEFSNSLNYEPPNLIQDSEPNESN